ncbi:hypothetical protein QZH41_014451, partial [Actinostola sp. cb2023]
MVLEKEEPLPQFQDVGCYVPKAFPSPYYASFRGQINWWNIALTVQQCAHVAYDMGRTYFGVRFYGECYSGPDNEVEDKLSNLRFSSDCWNGVGGSWSHYIYIFET